MTRKISKIIISTIAIMCIFCSSLTAFAENGDVDFDFNIQPIEPTTQQQVDETERETEKETEKQTEKVTEAETKKPTEKPTKPNTTEAPLNPDNSNTNNNNNVNVAVTQKVEETTEENDDPPLPEGSFYVYLERNNGQRRLKTVMNGAGYLPEPEEPVRKGYIFVGWYSDSSLETPWNFFKDKAKKEMTIYAKWTADEKTVAYDIIIEECVGGIIEVSPQKASLGEPVIITVKPDEGKRLVQGSIKINGEKTDFLNFIMPKGNVTVSAEFEDIPVGGGVSSEKSKLPIIIVIGIVAVIILAVIIVMVKRRMDFNADLDPEETLEDYEDENWIDESIQVEDGFKDGKKVVESVEPEYGAPDADEFDFE